MRGTDTDGTYFESLGDEVRHRFTTHPPVSSGTGQLLDELTARFIDLGQFLAVHLPVSNEEEIALNQLDTTLMWCKAAVARHQGQL